MKIYELFNDVGTDITVQQVSQMLKEANGDDITFKIATLGGNIDHGLACHDLIAQYKGHTIAEIIGMTASAGTIIALGCDTVKMSENALFLIHNSWTDTTGNAMQLRKTAEGLEKNDAVMVAIYKKKCSQPDNSIKKLMMREDWLSADEAKAFGLIDEITTAPLKAVASMVGLSNSLKLKLENRMNFFGKNKAKKAVHLYAMKDGSQLLASEEIPAADVEVAPIGAASLEDGEYELKDGKVIVVAGGMITEVKEAAEPEAKKPEESEAAIIEAVATMLQENEAKIEAKLTAFKASFSSNHKPAQAKGIESLIPKGDSIHARIRAKVAEIAKQKEE